MIPKTICEIKGTENIIQNLEILFRYLRQTETLNL
jgi:hypothetical protein